MTYAEVLPDETAITATGFLERAVAWFRDVLAERVMTDNGGCYRSHRVRCAVHARGARQIYTRLCRPQTNGKAERFIQTVPRLNNVLVCDN